MLGLLGMLGALMAGVLVDSLTQPDPAHDADDPADPQPEAESIHEDQGAATIFHMLSDHEASAIGDASPDETHDTSQDGVNASNDVVSPVSEDLWLTGDDLANILGGDAGNDLLLGQAGNDALAGQAGDDRLDGGAGDDALDGGAGDDSLAGAGGSDVLRGDSGDDGLAGSTGNDTLFGGEGDDSLAGDDGADSLAGGEGDDNLSGGGNADALDGGAGNDLLTGGAGSDTLDGGAGDDTIWGQTDTEHDGAPDFLNGGDGDDTLTLGAGDYGNGGDGADDFHLLDIGAGDPPMQITDYNPHEDQLVVLYDATIHPDPQLSVETSASGTTLLLDGVALARLQSVDHLDLGAITLQAA